MPPRFCKLIVILIAAVYAVVLLQIYHHAAKGNREGIARARRAVTRLERLLEDEKRRIAELDAQFNSLSIERKQKGGRSKGFVLPFDGEWGEPIPVLVFVCNRSNAIRNHLQKLLKYRPSHRKFPIVVSQDCDSEQVPAAIQPFLSSITYIKHPSAKTAGVTAEPNRKRYLVYYSIARHYKLGLSYIFDKLHYSTVIVTEDDLDIAPDFFEYFSATRKLLEADRSLFCVSAWNDNGKLEVIEASRPELLYRSDFFPGLGWMMTKKLWLEFGPQWPAGFWDDWIRDPQRRQNRSCIRPEISRTAMTPEGRKGASKGMFFKQHLRKIHLNAVAVNFTSLDLSYLLKDNYDGAFLERVYSTPNVSLAEFISHNFTHPRSRVRQMRIEYSTMQEYLEIADALGIMRDFKAGVPRTAYLGVVTSFIRSMRVYVAPNRSAWTGYHVTWEAPIGLI